MLHGDSSEQEIIRPQVVVATPLRDLTFRSASTILYISHSSDALDVSAETAVVVETSAAVGPGVDV